MTNKKRAKGTLYTKIKCDKGHDIVMRGNRVRCQRCRKGVDTKTEAEKVKK